MKLLVITQVVDTEHPVLGFFHKWIIELSKHVEELHVIALQVGTYNLPDNVHVHSLGKEDGVGRFVYIWRFYKYLFSFKYDHVFVHMNAEYVMLGGLFWKLLRKKVVLWYNHTVGSLLLRVSTPFVDVHMHTSSYAYPARYKDAVAMPAGIDTEVFKVLPEVSKKEKSIYFQGRVAPAKRVHVLLEAFVLVKKEIPETSLTIVGPEDEVYAKELKEKYASYIKNKSLVFMGPVPHLETARLFNEHTVSVNLTDDGNYDKTVLESLACGVPVIVSSRAFSDVVSESLHVDAPEADKVAQKLQEVFENVPDIDSSIVEPYSLPVLGKKIIEVYEA
ncbi:MAG: glycosyltransferase family 4 protein [Patescibacteria group bacterium UBA2103]